MYTIYTKKAMKNIRSLDAKVKERVKTEEDTALPDEIDAIREAREEIKRGELFSHEEVWA